MKHLISFLILLAFAGTAVAQEGNVPEPAPAPPPAVTVFPDLVNYPAGVNNRNYVRSYAPSKPTTNAADINMGNQITLPCIVNTRYFDGLGRPLQEVFRSGVDHAYAYDVVQVHAYDALGRQSTQYLPFTTDDRNSSVHGRLKTNAKDLLSAQYNTLYPGQQPYSGQTYDNSPLNRVTNTYAPGAAWIGNNTGKTLTYRANETMEEVRLWTIDPAPNSIPQSTAMYPAGTLQVSQVLDEDGQVSLEYKDMEGRLILRKQVANDNHSPAHNGYTCTYYVYDDLGRLRYVISPEAVNQVKDNGWDLAQYRALCYRYEYDERGRVIEKQLPGKDEEYLVYDGRDRLVLSQDGNLRNNGQWAFTYYDALGRPLQTGMYTAPAATRQSLAAAVTAVNPGYSTGSVLFYLNDNTLFNTYMPALSDGAVYTINYYDNYDRLPGAVFDGTLNSQLTGQTGYATLPAPSNLIRGLATGSRVKVMDGNNQFLNTTSFYDDNGRQIQQQGDNIIGGRDVSTMQYDFQGSVVSRASHHTNPQCNDTRYRSTTVVSKLTKNYLTGTILNEMQSINGTGFRSIYANTYDALGRLSNKKLGGAANNNYNYNIRGWLTGINKAQLYNEQSPEFFHEQLSYDDGFSSPLYNGNISGIIWRGFGTKSYPRAYGYNYDKLSRLNQAEFRENFQFAPSGSWVKNVNDFTASHITYDFNGNLLTMDQRGPGLDSRGNPSPVDMDVLTYEYADRSNKLISVTDAASGITTTSPDFKNGPNGHGIDDYAYDPNGNLVTDQNKGITNAITYSYLNKPEQIEVQNKGTISYLYDALGNKLRKTVNEIAGSGPVVTDYAGPFVYEHNDLSYLLHGEGRCRPNPADTGSNPSWLYDYFMKDHLGNVRSVINVKETMDPPTIYTAGLELSAANKENLVWTHLDEVRETKPGALTPDDLNAAGLDGTNPDKQIGTAIMLRVMPGDKFNLAGESWYDAVDNSNPAHTDQIIGSLMTALLGGQTYSGIPVSELPTNVQAIQTSLSNPEFVTAFDDLLSQNYDPQQPAAYLNYVLFDENFHMVPGSGAIQMGGSAGSWHLNELNGVIEVGQPGYLAVWTANKGTSKVFYDKIALTYYRGNVLEENHYYPFGLTLSAASANASEKNSIKFQGQRLEGDLGLNMYDYKYRMHDMQTGRFWQHDPLSEEYVHNSPYAFSENKVTTHVELEGLEAADFRIERDLKDVSTGKITNKQLSQRLEVRGKADAIAVAAGLAIGGALQALPAIWVSAAPEISAVMGVDATTMGYAGFTGTTVATTAIALESREAATVVAAESRGNAAIVETNASNMATLRNEVKATSANLRASGQSPATVVGARLPNGATAIGTSGPIPTNVSPALENAAGQIGGVGTRRAGNTIGCCAEFRTANDLLLGNPQYTPANVEFTPAIRPRTGEIVPMCQNCKDIFYPHPQKNIQ